MKQSRGSWSDSKLPLGNVWMPAGSLRSVPSTPATSPCQDGARDAESTDPAIQLRSEGDAAVVRQAVVLVEMGSRSPRL